MSKFLVRHSTDLENAVCEALGIEPTLVSRIIIDLQVGCPGRVYLETFADEASINIITPSLAFQIEEH